MACILNPALWVWLIWVIAGIAIARIVIPWIVSIFGLPAPLGQIIMILLWAVIAIAGVYFLFGLLSCIPSIGFPALPHR